MTRREPGDEAAADFPTGETLSVPERVIVAPAVGTFHRLDEDDSQQRDGYPIGRGDVIGVIRSLGRSTPIHSPFDGLLVAMLAHDGERVRPGQPVAWLRTVSRPLAANQR